ncbi:MAG: hypothetical protein IPL53_11395 [Ignavibacteria bacterium]|nr:hypothetical protein [Ignavibacteria bacterium]
MYLKDFYKESKQKYFIGISRCRIKIIERIYRINKEIQSASSENGGEKYIKAIVVTAVKRHAENELGKLWNELRI